MKQGIAKTKRNSWSRGNGPCSARGELRGGISKYKKILNRKVRRRSKVLLQNADDKKICKTGMMVDFTWPAALHRLVIFVTVRLRNCCRITWAGQCYTKGQKNLLLRING